MMKILIVEDEVIAYTTLRTLIQQIEPQAQITGPLQSIEEAIDYFQNNPMPDLIFLDVNLADGNSFTIFESVKVPCPIIFTTAYDQYALKAFEVNSIDYLLKPIDPKKLQAAIAKYQDLRQTSISEENINELKEALTKKSYKSCLLVSARDKIIPVSTASIAIVYLNNQMIGIETFEGENYYISSTTLDDIAKCLNPEQFYRANRQQIVNRNAINSISVWITGKLLLNLNVKFAEKVVVSKGKAAEFKRWLTN